jgi:hypothetical protein
MSPFLSEADVEMQILSAIISLGTVALEFVRGYQEDMDNGGEPLSWEAQLNQRCDELATYHLESAMKILPLVPFLPASNVSLTVNGTTPQTRWGHLGANLPHLGTSKVCFYCFLHSGVVAHT